MQNNQQSFWKALGPGILFAGAAIGTSHLVQSTRAGAVYGLGLLAVILFANFIKYPAYRFGPHYAAVTGKSLVDGYRGLGRWVVVLIGLIELPVMGIIIAATAVTTAAIFLSVFNLSWSASYVGCGLIILAGIILTNGGFKLLDILTKVFIIILTICTIAATFLALPNIQWNFIPAVQEFDFKTFAFIIALMGFMPSAMDLSIIHSLWTVEKAKNSVHPISLKAVITDLNVGYVISTVLAIFFLLMGTSVMYTSNIEPATSAPAFADQIISLYTTTLGQWSGLIVGLAAMAVMFTTLLTVLDGMPRLLAKVADLLYPALSDKNESPLPFSSLVIMTILLSLFAMIILIFLMKSFTTFIDLVTITSFLVAPIIAILNHWVVFNSSIKESNKPGNLLRYWSITGIIFLCILSIAYCYLLISS